MPTGKNLKKKSLQHRPKLMLVCFVAIYLSGIHFWRLDHSPSQIVNKPASEFFNFISTLLFAEVQAKAPPKKQEWPNDKFSEISVSNLSRTYLLHVPSSYTGNTAIPLVLVLHGGGGNSYLARRISGMNEKAEKEGFIVAYPNGTGLLKRHLLTWNAVDCCGYAKSKTINDVEFISSLIDKISADFNVDKSRVYIAGYSNGGMLAYLLASKLSHKVAAIACVGGSMSGKEKPPERPVSVIIFHGTADKHVPYTGGVGKLAKWGYPVNSMSVPYAVSFWSKTNECQDKCKQEELNLVTKEIFNHGKEDSEVVVYTIKGGLHSWPGGQRTWIKADLPFPNLSATDEIWGFFRRHKIIPLQTTTINPSAAKNAAPAITPSTTSNPPTATIPPSIDKTGKQ